MAFSLSDITRSITSALGGRSDASVIGIDIGTSSAKIVQLRPSRGVAILETYGEIALGPYNKQAIGKAVKLTPEATAELLLDLMKEANITSHQGGISIPFSSSLVSILDLPKADDEALKRMVPIEARKYIPVPITEVTLDWFVLPKDEGEKSAFDRVEKQSTMRTVGQEVLLVAIQNNILNAYKTISSNIGVSVGFYEIEIFSAIRSSLGHGLAPIVIVDIGASTTKIYVVERGMVRLTHLVTVGGQQMTETLARSMTWEFEKAERVKRERGLNDSTSYSRDENDKIKEALLSTLSRIFSEINRVVLSYGQRYNKNIAHVVLMGGGASLPGIADVARTSMNVDVEVANPFARTEAPAFLESVLKDIGPGFAVAVGVAMRTLKH